jgi:hypothetical protein
VLDVVNFAGGGGNEEVFGESASYAAGGCKGERSASWILLEDGARQMGSRTHNAPVNSGSFGHCEGSLAYAENEGR